MNVNRRLKRVGPVGSTAQTFQVAISATDAAVLFQSDGQTTSSGIPCEPAVKVWQAGTYTIRLNISTGNSLLTWSQVYIHRVGPGCGSTGLIASATGLGISLATTGVKTTQVVVGSDTAVNENDTLYISIVVTNASSMFQQAAQFVPDQLIDTPIVIPDHRMRMGVGT